MAASQRDRRPRLAARDRQRRRRLPRGARVPGRGEGRVSTRLETLAASLKAPLLVTDLTNVDYLTGLESSNAAVLVLPGGGATLYTDFRYIDVARQCTGVTVELTRRSIMQELAGSLPAGTQVEADALPYAQWQVLTDGGAKLVATRGIVETLRAVKDEAEVEKLRRAAKIGDRVLEALT